MTKFTAELSSLPSQMIFSHFSELQSGVFAYIKTGVLANTSDHYFNKLSKGSNPEHVNVKNDNPDFSARSADKMSHKNGNTKRCSRKQANGYHTPRSYAKQGSPYSSRGSSPAGSLRKSRSADERFGLNEKPPDSRGSQTEISDYSEQCGRKSAQTTSNPLIEDNISVCVRVRPLSKKELKTGDDSIVQFPGNGQILLGGQSTPGQRAKVFTYNVVFEPQATQEDVLQNSGIKRLIEMAVEGYNCTAFCYGQTGSGKTHTLTGPPGTFEGPVDIYSENHGLVFRSFMYLFKLLQERRDFHFVLKASFLEIYNEKVIDLLNGSSRKPLAIRWSKKSRGFFVENLFTVDCEELDDLMAVLEEGMKNRSVGRHNMNDYSSRSHTILTVHITSEQSVPEAGVFISKQGKINFVDLAGSEMTKKTLSEGKTLEEANNINKSLMVLGYCIASLSDSKKKTGHIPYRDSKLTKLLADSLAGNGVTLMIACISPARSNINETLNTLRYAARAKNITTKPIVVMDPREALILSLKREVTALQNENDHLRSLLNLNQEPLTSARSGRISNEVPLTGSSIAPSPGIDLEKLPELDGQELVELVKHYMNENDALRKENAELFSTRDILIRDQEMVCRENERLLKKLEDVNSVCCRSPIIPARPTFSADMFNGDSDIVNGSFGNSRNDDLYKIPDSIQKEMSKRQIGKSVAETITPRRQNYIENRNISSTGSEGSTSSSDKKPVRVKHSSGIAESDSLHAQNAKWIQPTNDTKSSNYYNKNSYIPNSLNDTPLEDDDDDDDVKSPSFSSGSRGSGRNSSATTLPIGEKISKTHHVFGSTVSLRDTD